MPQDVPSGNGNKRNEKQKPTSGTRPGSASTHRNMMLTIGTIDTHANGRRRTKNGPRSLPKLSRHGERAIPMIDCVTRGSYQSCFGSALSERMNLLSAK